MVDQHTVENVAVVKDSSMADLQSVGMVAVGLVEVAVELPFFLAAKTWHNLPVGNFVEPESWHDLHQENFVAAGET